MNNASSSPLQKASFVLLVFIACALAYLIVRGHLDAQRTKRDAESVVASSSSAIEPARGRLNSSEMKSSFAPLRPRVETNVVRVLTNRTITYPAKTASSVSDQSGGVPSVVPMSGLNSSPQPVPAGFARGVAEVASGASIFGRVTLRGTPPPEKAVTLDVSCGRLHPAPMTTRHYVVGESGGLANVFVYVKTGIKPQKTPQTSVPLLDNINCEFQPYMLGVRAGQPFAIRNSDPTLHNAHTFARVPGNTEFNLGLPTRGMTVQRVFQKPEVLIQVKCDVHPWMFAFIGVVDHQWFSVTDANGNFAIPTGLPHGRYTIAAVHPKAGESLQEISVDEGVPVTTSFTLDVPDTLARQ